MKVAGGEHLPVRDGPGPVGVERCLKRVEHHDVPTHRFTARTDRRKFAGGGFTADRV